MWLVIKQTKNLEFRILIHIFYVFIQIFNVTFQQILNKLNSNLLSYYKYFQKNKQKFKSILINIIFCLEKTIVVSLITFEQIILQKLWADFITTLILYYLDVYEGNT